MKQNYQYQPDVQFNTLEDAKAIADEYHTSVFQKNEGYGGNAQKLEQLKNTRKVFGRNSDRYKAVLQGIDAVEDLMSEKISHKNPEVYENLMAAYAALCGACSAYIGTSDRKYTSVGKKRLELVKKVYENAEKEVLMLQMQYIQRNGDFTGGGISFRQLYAGEGIPQEIRSDAADFSLGEIEPEPAGRAEKYRLGLKASAFRERIAAETGEIDGNSNTIGILLEYYQRILGRLEADPDSESLIPEVLMRIRTLCDGQAAGSVMAELTEEVDRVLQETGVKPGISGKVSYMKRGYQKLGTIKEEDLTREEEAAARDQFSDYPVITDREAQEMAGENSYNSRENAAKLYGELSDEGGKHGYIQTANSFDINEYLRNQKFDSVSYESHKTIGMLDAATQENRMPHKARFYRLLRGAYMEHALGMGEFMEGEECKAGTIQAINRMAGRVVTDAGYMCVGYQLDMMFGNAPVLLTLLCDEGMPFMATTNYEEGEFIFPRNTSYMILGARKREDKSSAPLRTIVGSSKGKEKNKGYFYGIEIICKVLNPAKA